MWCDMSDKPILTRHENGLAYIRLHRPDALNAVNGELCAGLRQAIIDADNDDSVQAVLISGEGRAFCAGGDLNAIKRLCNASIEALHATLSSDFAAVRQVYHCAKPTVAAVHGAVVGGGAGIAAACDFVVAEAGARFAFPFLELGIIPDMCVLYGLTQRTGLQAARRLLLRGTAISAEEAKCIGLVDEISPTGCLMRDAEALAVELSRRGGPAMSFSKRHLNQIGQMSFDESMEKEILYQTLLWKTEEVRRRCDTLLEKLQSKKT